MSKDYKYILVSSYEDYITTLLNDGWKIENSWVVGKTIHHKLYRNKKTTPKKKIG